MKWIQVTHINGTDLINFEQLYRIGTSSTNDILFYSIGSNSPTALAFSTSIERDEIFEKFQKVLVSLNINRIAAQ